MNDKWINALQGEDIPSDADKLARLEKQFDEAFRSLSKENEGLKKDLEYERKRADAYDSQLEQDLRAEIDLLTRKLARAHECIRLLVAVSANLTVKD